jgi:hypothetical protein
MVSQEWRKRVTFDEELYKGCTSQRRLQEKKISKFEFEKVVDRPLVSDTSPVEGVERLFQSALSRLPELPMQLSWH